MAFYFSYKKKKELFIMYLYISLKENHKKKASRWKEESKYYKALPVSPSNG
jgi:hypothetical protein